MSSGEIFLSTKNPKPEPEKISNFFRGFSKHIYEAIEALCLQFCCVLVHFYSVLVLFKFVDIFSQETSTGKVIRQHISPRTRGTCCSPG